MSRRSHVRPILDGFHDQTDVVDKDASDHRMIDLATALFGSDAPTAVAFCALDAWSEGNQEEYRFWSRIFQRLRN